MLLARRKFLRSSLLFGASAVLLYGNSPSAFARSLTDELSRDVLLDPVYSFTRETFEPYVGGYFQAPGARGEMIALKLVKVDSYEPQTDTKISTGRPVASESFSLLFSAEAPLPSHTSIHQVKHGALGDFSLFLSRRTGASREIFYEAVFGRLA